ncbi:MAG: hypothetical protein ACYDGN_13005 [Acidimicrobiales bacterium]
MGVWPRPQGPLTARAFLRGSDPLLGDQAPLAVIAVIAAARVLLEG